jgi:hypothetical protein
MIITIAILLVVGLFIGDFFQFIEQRRGHRIEDFLLSRIPLINVSFYTFLSIYTAILLSIFSLGWRPVLFLKCLQAYCFLVLMRIATLYLVPLEPELSIIPLQDPFVGYFFYNNSVITKDLFFSGHISMMSLLALVNPDKQIKMVIIILTIITIAFILVQHVHYTVDIIAAPLFSWISYKLAMMIPVSIAE